jgi:hypothetical protein
MTSGLQPLDQQTLGSFDADEQSITVTTKFALQLGQARDVVRHTFLAEPAACMIDDTQLMVRPTPVDAREHAPFGLIRHLVLL